MGTSNKPAFERSERNADDTMVGTYRYIVATSEGKAVIENKSNGQSFFMGYRTERGARQGLQRASAVLSDLQVIERDW